MNEEKITLEINGDEVEAVVMFDYKPGRPAYTSGLPENCYPAESDEIHINELFIAKNEASFLLDLIDNESIIEELFEIINKD